MNLKTLAESPAAKNTVKIGVLAAVILFFSNVDKVVGGAKTVGELASAPDNIAKLEQVVQERTEKNHIKIASNYEDINEVQSEFHEFIAELRGYTKAQQEWAQAQEEEARRQYEQAPAQQYAPQQYAAPNAAVQRAYNPAPKQRQQRQYYDYAPPEPWVSEYDEYGYPMTCTDGQNRWMFDPEYGCE